MDLHYPFQLHRRPHGSIYKENEHAAKLITDLHAFGRSYEAALGGSGALGEIVRFIENDEKGIHELYAFITVSFFLRNKGGLYLYFAKYLS